MEVNFSHPEKPYCCISVTLAGMTISYNSVSEKVNSPIDFKLSGSSMYSNDLQFVNAPDLMIYKPSFNSTQIKFLKNSNMYPPIPISESGHTTCSSCSKCVLPSI